MRRGLSCALLALAACGGDTDGPDPSASTSTGAGGPGSTPTWWGDVAPIVYDECVDCHQSGGIAPLELVDYEDVRELPGLIGQVVASRTMPPFGADNGGDCHTFRDARWLSQEQIDTIGAWVDAGAPEGDPALAPEMPSEPKGLEQVDRTLDIGVEYTPSEDADDDYRCFVVDPEIAQDMYLTGFELKPGDARVVHHAILFAIEDEQAEQQAEQLASDASKPGYQCFGGPRVSANFAAGWAPGTPATEYPEDTGVPLKAGRKAVLQIHYNTINGTWSDRTTMDLRLAESVPHEAIITPIADYDLELPPAMEYVETSHTETNPSPVPVRVHGVFPHMHELGDNIRISVERDGEEVCLVDVPEWDFDWQQLYLYDEPIEVQPGDDLTITCGYSTLGRNETVYWGEGTQDEMCLNFFYVTP